jgi:hypothetical protein
MINTTNGKIIENKKVIYRNDTGDQLGVVNSSYGIIQNTDQFAFCNTLCKEHGISITKVREYNGGAVINLQASIKDRSLAVKVGDECGFFIDFWNGFNGLQTARGSFGALRLVCTNGLIGAGRNMEAIEIKHTKHAVQRFEQAVKVWAGFETWYNTFKEATEILNRKMVDKRMVDSFLDSLFGDSESTKMQNKKELVVSLFEHGKGNQGKTAWDLLNASTEYIDHESKKTEEERIEYANIGGGYDIKAKAFNLAMTLN